MEQISNFGMYVLYKSKELFDEAQARGEHEWLKEEYYKFIKPYDPLGYLTREKHFRFGVYYPENYPSKSQELYEISLDTIQCE